METGKKTCKARLPANLIVYICIIIGSIVLGACIYHLVSTTNGSDHKDEAIENCMALCRQETAKGTIISNGPCLSNNIAEGWVCDIVSNPRNKLIDDLPDNQCEAYREGIADSFVEVTPECELVRTS